VSIAVKSPNVEIDDDRRNDVDRSAIQSPRFEPPLGCCSGSFAVESIRIKGSCDANVRGNTAGSHNQLEHYAAFNTLKHGPIRIGGVDLQDHTWRCDRSAGAIRKATCAATGSIAQTRASARTDASADAFANPSTRAGAERCADRNTSHRETRLFCSARRQRFGVENQRRRRRNDVVLSLN